jgi:hypothetical protein
MDRPAIVAVAIELGEGFPHEAHLHGAAETAHLGALHVGIPLFAACAT